jgi:hypothetical protein
MFDCVTTPLSLWTKIRIAIAVMAIMVGLDVLGLHPLEALVTR